MRDTQFQLNKISEAALYIPKIIEHITLYEDTRSIAYDKIKEQQQVIEKYEKGHKGACFACEPVGELNIELERVMRLMVGHVYKIRDSMEECSSHGCSCDDSLIEEFLNDPPIRNYIKEKG